jgi:hypothetical protein
MLLAMQGIAPSIGFIILGWMLAVHRHHRLQAQVPTGKIISAAKSPRVTRPACWIAIRSVSPEAVKTALGLNHAAPCSWAEGLIGSHEFFVSPRLNGWVVVTGLGLPNPTEDVDATFLFLTGLSKELGHVQFFYASRLLHHHAWARLDDGCVTRAYAWAGETVWNEGPATRPELDTDMKMFGYGDHSATILDAEMNFEKVPALAARWSLDPAQVRLHSYQTKLGGAGESAFG